MALAGLYLYAYLVGSIPTAYLLAKLVKGIDVRAYGSGNVGGSNLAQQVGKRWLLPLLTFDVLVKGASPFLVGQHLLELGPDSKELLAAPLLTLAGNNWSVFLKFQGGRGIIVVVGALAVVSPWLLAIGLGIYLAGWAPTRNSPVWVLVSLAALPAVAAILGLGLPLVWFCAALFGMAVAKRLTANGFDGSPSLSAKKVLLNRLVFDRDVDRREDWVHRSSETPKQ